MCKVFGLSHTQKGVKTSLCFQCLPSAVFCFLGEGYRLRVVVKTVLSTLECEDMKNMSKWSRIGNEKCRKAEQADARIQRRSSSTEGRLPPNVVFHRKSSSTEGRLPPKVVYHRRLSSTEGQLPLKVVFHQSLSSIEGRLPPWVVFHLP